jgi:hypothetical protein
MGRCRASARVLGERTVKRRPFCLSRKRDGDGMCSARRFAEVLRKGFRPGVRASVVDPVAERARLLEADATLVWASAKCTPPFRVLLGHSMGSESVMRGAGPRRSARELPAT